MANTDQKLVISDLDFSQIKTNLKNFLRDQDEFKDFDYEAAGINTMLDILAYNTHYMAFYNNMIANEMFLDTAIMRDSVVSHAKMLGYTPRSSSCPRARVDLQITRPGGSTLTSLTLPKFTRFQSSPINSISYTFVNKDSVVGNYDLDCGRFCFHDLYLYQGQPLTYTFVYDQTGNPNQSFELPDSGVDTSTLEVQIQESSTSLRRTKYTLSTDATTVASDSATYFLDESRGGKYKIYFGDDVIGKKLVNGNIVIITYLITEGTSANKANAFSLIESVGGLSNHVVYPLDAASGGSGQETIEGVRFSAPKAYVANGRGVTKDDLISILNKNYPYFQSINVWGGEESDPPVYGKIFIAAKPTSGYEITESEKLDVIENYLKPLCVVTVKPEFVDVDYNYLNINAEVYYDKTKTNQSTDAIQTIVRSAIVNYADSDLNDFNSKFKVSKLLRYIDDSETSVNYSDAVTTITKRLEPVFGAARNYTLNFGTRISNEDPHYRIFSSPAFYQYDKDAMLRQCFLEEIPGISSGIDSISVTSTTSLYEVTDKVFPTVVIIGDGVNATAKPVIVNGKLVAVDIVDPGLYYTNAVAYVYYNGALDYTAILTVSIANRYGVLRSYYFDDLNIKTPYDSAAGSIDYIAGTIVLNEFDPVSIDDPLKVLRITAKPVSNNFESSRNRILTIDSSDAGSVTITVKTT